MRNTTLAVKAEYDEVPVSSTEVIESHVVAIRDDLSELKNDFRAAVARIDNDIKAAVVKLETEIRTMAAKAEKDLEKFANGIGSQLAEMRQDVRELRVKDEALAATTNTNFQTLNTKIDANHKDLSAKIDANHKELSDKIQATDAKMTGIDSKLKAFFWVVGGLVTLISIGIAVGNAARWF